MTSEQRTDEPILKVVDLGLISQQPYDPVHFSLDLGRTPLSIGQSPGFLLEGINEVI